MLHLRLSKFKTDHAVLFCGTDPLRRIKKMQVEVEAPRKLHGINTPTEPISVKLISKKENELVFDLANTDPAFANALRRVMLAEVPSIAIETVNIYMNRSVMHDEVLAHRIGLIPINIDPKSVAQAEEIIFKLHVRNTSKQDRKVYSKDLKLISMNDITNPLVHDDILITILVPGEEIELECFCAVGIGADHSKFSPVATVSYRNLPVLNVLDKNFKELITICPTGVFEDVEDLVVATNPRKCTFCRECLRNEVEHNDPKVSLQRKTDFFIFHIESVGVLSPEEIFLRALEIIKLKSQRVINHF